MQWAFLNTTIKCFTFILIIQSQFAQAEEWELEKQKNNVQVSSRKTPSGYKEILVATTVKVHPHALINLLDDIEFAPNWIHNCLEIKLIERSSPSTKIIHSFFSAPWPVKNRDMVTFSETYHSAYLVSIKISDRGDMHNMSSDYVRMTNMHGEWKAEMTKNGMTTITYQGGGNPGGNLPTFIANKELISSMFKTFVNLNEVILLDKYKHREITH